MAKRTTTRARTKPAATRTPAATATAADATEGRIIALAEQLGRMAGAVQAKAQGWMDRDALSKQVASVRDSATTLLQHLAGIGAKATPAKAPKRKAARSGGAVDAPGKTHRKRTPADPGAKLAKAQAAKVRTALSMEKTKRLRGRG
jgi:hypothetical protein